MEPMAEIMAGTQRTRNPKIIIAASYCAVFCFLLGPAFLFTVWPDDAGAAELRVLPSVAVSEEYTDNVFLTRYNKEDDYITRVVPAVTLKYKTALWDWNLDLAYDYRYYARGTKTEDSTYEATLNNRTELIENFFFIDVLDTYKRVSLDVTRDYTKESPFVNQSDQNIFAVNPYIVMRSESRFTPILGYKYVNTWYKQANVTSTVGLPVSTVDNIGYAEMITDLSSMVTFTIGARYTQDVNKVENYNKTDIYAGPKYTYAPNSYLYCLIGESFLDFQFQNSTTKHVIWDAGITHRYSTVEVAYRMRSDYVPDPLRVLRREDRYVATVTKETPRTALGILAGLYEYRDAPTNHLESTIYRLTGTVKHALSPTLTLLLNESIERHDDNVANTTVALWISGVRLEHRMLADLILALDFNYTNSYSHDIYTSNYINNRFIVGLTKRF
jgi:hypothetical protein